MKIIDIDYGKCTDCLRCIKVCPSKLYIESKRDNNKITAKFANPFGLCVRCGHCIAICPTEAIKYSDADQPFNIGKEMKLDKIVSYENLLKILRMRRSMRVYKKENIPRDKIDAILEAMRYAPSASNRQNWRYTVITDKQEIKYLSKESSSFFRVARKLLPLRFLVVPFLSAGERKRVLNPSTKIQLDSGLKRMEEGEDIIFFNAPCVIILYARKYTKNLAANDAGVALTHGMLAAQALGLGSCWIGFAQRKLNGSRKLKKRYKIPKGFDVLGVITIGNPAVEYRRAPPRRKLRVQWIE